MPQLERFYLPELDSLRFFAFLSVFLGHAFPGSWPARASGFGVDLFFVLSAFLISELLLREREQFGVVDVRAFWLRRALRIWPLYFGMLSIALLLHRPLLIPLKELALYALFVGNFIPILIAHSFPSALINALWTVSIEEQFYMSWPLIMRRLSRRSIFTLAVVLFAGAAVSRAVIVAIGRGPVAVLIAQATPCRIDAIAVGLAISASRFRVGPAMQPWLAAVSVAIVVLAGAWVYVLGGALSQILCLSAVGLACGGLLLSSIGTVWMRFGPTCYLGRISYGLYVFHGPALLIARILGFAVAPTAALVTVGLSVCSYRYLERPFLVFKMRFERLPSRPI